MSSSNTLKPHKEDNKTTVKNRPLSNSFNEITNSAAKKDHELYYFKSYSGLTETELFILRKTAYANLRNQFRSINQSTVDSSSHKNSSSNISINKNDSKSSLTTDKQNLNNHNASSSLPGKDFRETIIKSLESVSKGRNNKKWKIFSKKDKKREVFGVPLVTSLDYAFVYIDPNEKCNNKKLPIIVYECINFLRKNGLSKEGIFRVNGSERRINSCVKIFNESAGYGFGYNFEGMNIFDVASLLKLYLRQLPEPLIPFCLYTTFLDVVKYIPDTCERTKAFQYLFVLLPSAHLVVLEILLQFLSEVTEHFEVNHMNAHNLACIFAPNLLRSKESASSNSNNILTLASSEEYEVALQVIEFLIDHKDKLFITSSEVKPFQLFDNFEKDPIALDKEDGPLEGINSLSVSDFTTFQKSNNIMDDKLITPKSNLKYNNTDNNNTVQVKNGIKIEITNSNQEEIIKGKKDVKQQQEIKKTNIKSELLENNSNKNSNMETLSSLSNSKVNQGKLNHPSVTPITINNKTNINDYGLPSPGYDDSSISNESLSTNSNNNQKENNKGEMPSPEMIDKNSNNDQNYPSNVMNLAQKNKEKTDLSFLSPLSTPTQPIISIPTPPKTTPSVVLK